jgi:enamidase
MAQHRPACCERSARQSLALIDAPDGGTQDNASVAITHGEMAAGAVITAGVPRLVGRSRDTPATTRQARVVRSRVMQEFAAAGG